MSQVLEQSLFLFLSLPVGVACDLPSPPRSSRLIKIGGGATGIAPGQKASRYAGHVSSFCFDSNLLPQVQYICQPGQLLEELQNEWWTPVEHHEADRMEFSCGVNFELEPAPPAGQVMMGRENQPVMHVFVPNSKMSIATKALLNIFSSVHM